MGKEKHTAGIVYLLLTLTIFVVATIVFIAFPRPAYSELEKRTLAEFPEFSIDALTSGQFAEDISHWFNDTEPFRDNLMELSMAIRHRLRLTVGGEEAVSVHIEDSDAQTTAALDSPADSIGAAVDDGVAKIANKGIIVVGTGENVRALMAFGGEGGGNELVRVAKRYASEMPELRVYEMVLPLASEFYMPEKVKGLSKPQIATIDNIRSLTSGTSVCHIDAYSVLKRHLDEPIYLRTDHHWAPLGAYYASEEFARVAGVPFRQLSDGYTEQTIHRFVGSMYGYSKDISVKNAPEDFVYYLPDKVNYTTTFRRYSTDKKYNITSESAPFHAPFFKKYPDGSSLAYSTFMGGDAMLTTIRTDVANGRRLLIVKDSYGNAVPGFLFYSFEEIHVVDFRYFTHNMVKYCRDNSITDLIFIFNIFNAYSSAAPQRAEKFLTQQTGIEREKPTKPSEPAVSSESSEPSETSEKSEPTENSEGS